MVHVHGFGPDPTVRGSGLSEFSSRTRGGTLETSVGVDYDNREVLESRGPEFCQDLVQGVSVVRHECAVLLSESTKTGPTFPPFRSGYHYGPLVLLGDLCRRFTPDLTPVRVTLDSRLSYPCSFGGGTIQSSRTTLSC